MVKKEVIAKIKDFITLLKQNNINVNKVFLFGSYAFGDANEVSDIDVAVISSDFGKSYLKECLLLMKIANEIDLSLSPKPYSLDEYKKAKQGDFLWQEIINKGHLIDV